tara:strand:+ start:1724 stop:1840 length:117 start_codon:yes stop_codon:yes gene_type:complete
MTNIEKQYIINQYNKMLREQKEINLVYRGTAYSKSVLK